MIATFGAGCFWGVEAAFRKIQGVIDTAVGYSGGSTEAPSYQEVCGGDTGHTEVVQVTYDPDKVSYEDLLRTFWKIHNAAVQQKTQYRSVIFFHTPEQELAARGMIQGTTTLEPAATFHRAEEYHQRYLET